MFVDLKWIWLQNSRLERAERRSSKHMSYYEYIKRRVRHSGVTRLALEALAKIGFNLRPFVLFRETAGGESPFDANPAISDAEFKFLGAEDMPTLASYSNLPGRNIPETVLLERLQAGNKCAALFLDGNLAGFSWCDFEQCSFQGYSFKLKDNEVYLFDAFTPIAFRGKGLGPQIRKFLYQELMRQGRDVFYSMSDRLNRPAIRFKEKLNAKRLVTGYYLVLFSRWRFSFLIKQIDAEVPEREG